MSPGISQGNSLLTTRRIKEGFSVRLYLRLVKALDAQEEKVNVDQTLALKMQQALTRLGYYAGPLHGEYDEATRKAYEHYCHVENFEERLCPGNVVDSRVLDFLL